MDLQFLIVAATIFGAVVYIGAQMRRRAKSFSPQKSCGDNCGCGAGGGEKIKTRK